MKPSHAALRCSAVRGLHEKTPFREERASFACEKNVVDDAPAQRTLGPLTMANV